MKFDIFQEANTTIINVKNSKNLELFLSELGAGIYKIVYKNEIMNYGPKSLDVYTEKDQYYGKTIARFAGRIKNAKWNNINFEANENSHLLHSGINGLHNKRFKYTIRELKDCIKIIFKATDSGKKSRFPGKFSLQVVYKIYDNIDKFEISFISKCDEDCITNITNHAYFCLGSKSLNDLKMKINSSYYVAVDNELIATEIKPVNRTFDFRRFKTVTRDIYDKNLQEATSAGYDHLFVFDSKNAAKPQLFLKNDRYQLRIYTDFEAIQFYANCYPQSFENLNGEIDGLYKAAALEPQLNTFDINHTIQKAGVKRKNRIIYRFDSINE